MTSLTGRQALAWRMERHGLCGLHAQVASSADLTAFVRGVAPDREGLIKTWAVRGTLHLLPLAELGMWQSALSTFDHFLKGAWVRAFGFTTADEVEQMISEIAEALDGRSLTREELAEALPHHGEKLRESWGSALKPAAFRGLLAFDDPDGQTVRFTRPPQVKRPPADEALRALTRRYLAAYAPARREDLSRWWGSHGLSPAKAQKRFEALSDEAVQVDLEGERCWVLAEDLDAMREAAPSRAARLVPLFDQYVVNSNRGVAALVPAAARPLVFRQAGWISASLIVDGAVAGVWRHDRRGARLEIAIEPFGTVTKRVRAQAEADAARLADHLGAVPEITWK